MPMHTTPINMSATMNEANPIPVNTFPVPAGTGLLPHSFAAARPIAPPATMMAPA